MFSAFLNVLAKKKLKKITGNNSKYVETFFLFILIFQNKAVDELRSIFGQEKHRQPTIQDLNDMKYIELIIKETLRMYPSVPLFGRKLEENATFSNIQET